MANEDEQALFDDLVAAIPGNRNNPADEGSNKESTDSLALETEQLFSSKVSEVERAMSAAYCRSSTPSQDSVSSPADAADVDGKGSAAVCESGSPASGGSMGGSPLHHVKTTTWWAPLIKAHLAFRAKSVASDQEVLQHSQPRKVISACSGSCAEAEVLKDPCLQAVQ